MSQTFTVTLTDEEIKKLDDLVKEANTHDPTPIAGLEWLPPVWFERESYLEALVRIHLKYGRAL